MNVLYIGGTGEISYACVQAGAAMGGQRITVFNRGKNAEPLAAGVGQIAGDIADDAGYRRLGEKSWDVVCQFKAYDAAAIRRDAEVFGGKIGQYIFISTASAYRKPPADYVLREETPLENPFWDYSRDKIAAEKAVREAEAGGRWRATIVRPEPHVSATFSGIGDRRG